MRWVGVRGEKYTICIAWYSFPAMSAMTAEAKAEDSLPAVPVHLAHYCLVRRRKSREVTFSQSAKRLAFNLLSFKRIEFNHLASFFF